MDDNKAPDARLPGDRRRARRRRRGDRGRPLGGCLRNTRPLQTTQADPRERSARGVESRRSLRPLDSDKPSESRPDATASRCPSRPPDWRWKMAGLLVDGVVRPSRGRDDAWVVTAVQLPGDLRRCRDEVDREALAERMPDLPAAHRSRRGTAPATGPSRRGFWPPRGSRPSPPSTRSRRGRVAFMANFLSSHGPHGPHRLHPALGHQAEPRFVEHGPRRRLEVARIPRRAGGRRLHAGTGPDPASRCARPGRGFMVERPRDELLRKAAVAALTLPLDGARGGN